MLEAGNNPLEELFARACDRAERFELSLGHGRSGGPAFAEASALYPWGVAVKRAERLQ